jgi:hypothetical protein
MTEGGTRQMMACCGARTLEEWLRRCHVCCWPATYEEHFVAAGIGACPRRFLATPLYEIFVSKTSGHGKATGSSG